MCLRVYILELSGVNVCGEKSCVITPSQSLNKPPFDVIKGQNNSIIWFMFPVGYQNTRQNRNELFFSRSKGQLLSKSVRTHIRLHLFYNSAMYFNGTVRLKFSDFLNQESYSSNQPMFLSCKLILDLGFSSLGCDLLKWLGFKKKCFIISKVPATAHYRRIITVGFFDTNRPWLPKELKDWKNLGLKVTIFLSFHQTGFI